MNKRIIFLIVLLVAGGLAAWYFYFEPLREPEPVGLNLPEVKVPQVISSAPAIGPVASHDGNKIWYGTAAGVLKRYELSTNQETEYPGPRPPGQLVTDLIWPLAGNDLIFKTMVEGAARYHYFNSESQAYTTLPSAIINMSWLNDGRRVVYTWRTIAGKIQLVMANADGTGYRKVADVPWDDLVPLASPTDTTAIMYRPLAEGPINKIYLFNLETGAYTEISSDGWATGAKWLPNGQQVAISLQEAGTNKLYLYDLATQAPIATNISASTNQIAFSQDSLYLYAIVGKSILQYNTQSHQMTTYYEFPDSVSAKSLIIVGGEVFYLGFDNVIRSIEK